MKKLFTTMQGKKPSIILTIYILLCAVLLAMAVLMVW